ncbi:MAG: thiol-disulfide oxidoreductase DCC family protein [Pseudomonadota bacterium]
MLKRPYYSYRYDARVPTFPDDAPLVIFDGKSSFCAALVRFILRHDSAARMRFAAAQGPLATALYRHYGLAEGTYETLLFIADGQAWIKSDAFIEMTRRFGGLWRAMTILRPCPHALRDRLYDWVARRRAGKVDQRPTSPLTAADQAGRFLT